MSLLVTALLCLSSLVFAMAAPSPPTVVDHANWMRDLMPIIANATLLDLSIPGTHDSMTWDLSSFVADGAEDIPLNLSMFLHDLGNPLELGQYVRNQVRGAS